LVFHDERERERDGFVGFERERKRGKRDFGVVVVATMESVKKKEREK
jgi:hypothetical protein